MKKRRYIVITVTNHLGYSTCILRDGKLSRSLSEPATIFDDYKEAYKFKHRNEQKMKRDGDIYCYYVIIPIETKNK